MRKFICGDLHLRKEEPFFSAGKNVLNILKENLNSGDWMIFTGDLFHTSRIYTEESNLARDFFEDCKRKGVKVTVLAGNHEYFHSGDNFAEDIFRKHDIEFIDYPCVSNNIIFMPYISTYRLKKLGYDSMKDFYESQIEGLAGQVEDKEKPVYLIYHFEDETVFMGGNELGVDLTGFSKYLKHVVRLGGHVHLKSKNYVGTPYATRKDESRQECEIVKIDEDRITRISIPEMIRYEDLIFEDLDVYKFESHLSYIFKVFHSPSSDELNKFIASRDNVYLDDYELAFGEERVIIDEKEDIEDKSILNFFEIYRKQNSVSPEVSNYLLGIL